LSDQRAFFRAEDPETLHALDQFEHETGARQEIASVVGSILETVKTGGDDALLEYTARFDGVTLDREGLRVTKSELDAGLASLPKADVENILRAKAQIESFHRKTIPNDWEGQNGDGATVGERYYPIRAVGLYVPGGNVPLVSSVLMSAVLARLAGNPRIAVVTPPLKDGSIAPGMLGALKLCGITEIYKAGGAQAIAALAFGTQTIPRVDKVFGPGNAYVLEAKRQVFGTVGVDLMPGPSEVAIVADATCNPAWVAADLIAQAEHGSGKERVLLLVSNESLFEPIDAALEDQIPARNHAAAIRKVLDHRCMRVVFESLEGATRILNRFAPEHLELQVSEESIAHFSSTVTTAGAMLLGHYSPTVLGDFTAGPSHTLPTGGAGRFMSGLRLVDFMRRTSVVRYERQHLLSAAPVVATFSRLEQLDGHGNSLKIRLD
jgi:histidinol dehydrogenase